MAHGKSARRFAASEVDDPNPWRAEIDEARTCTEAGRLDDAEAILNMCLSSDPDAGEVHHCLGRLQLQAGEPVKAYEHFKIAAGHLGEMAEVWVGFGRCLALMRQFDAALVAYDRAISIGPATADMYMAQGLVYHELGQADDAITAFNSVLVMWPGHDDALHQRAIEFQIKGDFKAARDGFLQVLEQDPGRTDAMLRLVNMGDVQGQEELVVDGLLRSANASETSVRNKTEALYAAADVRRRQARHDQAFALFAQANTLSRTEAHFDRAELAALVDLQIESFTPEVFQTHHGGGEQTDLPVFIVGMPRSGSTLVEQIISSHGQVGSAGEFGKIENLDAVLKSTSSSARFRYPNELDKIDPEKITPFARQYLQALTERGGTDWRRITDKSLFNFLHLGLIALLFPKAVIIHCRRDARDLGLSCFFQNFANRKALAFTLDMADIGFFIGQYRRLMAHWHAVLPLPILDIDYEQTVAELETTGRKAIAHIGLEWDEACLKPHENRRMVKTASFWQVRQPVYGSSVGVWRNYETYLDPLLAELGESGS